MIVLISKNNEWSREASNLVSRKLDDVIFLNKFSIDDLRRIQPDWIFFFHWSEIVPESIFNEFRCVVIHTGNLPDDRGGSPIQNQILKGTVSTRVNLIEMKSEVDSGGIYTNKQITLQGSLRDIWFTIAGVASDLIIECVQKKLSPIPQSGNSNSYKRRKNNELIFEDSKDISYIYDQIRMLDAEDYPNPYIQIGRYVLEFSRAKIINGEIISDVKIIKK
jgi:methionyl-tRNA formyltransferase